MEEVFFRFPHLKEDIFNALDDKTFANCKEVSKVWYNNLNDQKFIQKRRVRVFQVMIAKFQQDFQQKGQNYISNIPVQTILNEARKGNFDMVHTMIMVGFKKMYYPNSYHPIRQRPLPLCILLLADNNEQENVFKYIGRKYVFRMHLNSWDCIPTSYNTSL